MNTATITTPVRSPFAALTPETDWYREGFYPSFSSYLSLSLNAAYPHDNSAWLSSKAVAIWHEAQWLDVLHDAYAMNATFPWVNGPAAIPVELSAHERDLAAAQRQAVTLNATSSQREKLRAIIEARRDAEAAAKAANDRAELLAQRITALQTEQITDGGDIRLREFWRQAMQNATENDFCSEYDRMAEALGGPRRDQTYTVDFEVTVRFSESFNLTPEEAENFDPSDHIGSLSDIDRMVRNNVDVESWNYVSVADINAD